MHICALLLVVMYMVLNFEGATTCARPAPAATASATASATVLMLVAVIVSVTRCRCCLLPGSHHSMQALPRKHHANVDLYALCRPSEPAAPTKNCSAQEVLHMSDCLQLCMGCNALNIGRLCCARPAVRMWDKEG